MTTIRPEFASHQLNAAGTFKVQRLKEAFSKCLDEVDVCMVGPQGTGSRERSIVITEMQRTLMMAVRGISVQPENQLPPVPAPVDSVG